jgi:putative nucleotidyltransferase with HDIG domain
MKFRLTPQVWHNLFKGSIFISVIALISYLLPNQNAFNYQFDIGKPWSYDLITASFDFPIYKSDEQLQNEKKALLEDFKPYYRVDTTMAVKQFERLEEHFTDQTGAPLDPAGEIRKQWNAVYQQGIISPTQLNLLQQENTVRINYITPNKVVVSRNISDLYTPKTAYEKLSKVIPPSSGELNIHLYIVENLQYDSVINDLSRNEMLTNLSLTSGMVQAGERVIDRGEIVNEETFRILNSMKIESNVKNRNSLERSYLVVFGEIILVTGLILFFFLYLHLFRPRIFNSLNHLIFINLLILIVIAISSMVREHTSVSYFMIPFALLPVIVRVFFDSRTALFAHIIAMMIIALIVDNPFQFLIIQIAVGMTAVSSLKDMTQRSQLAQTALLIFVTYSLVFLSLEFISEGDLMRVNWRTLLYFAISSGFMLFAYLLIYIFEKLFGLISAITLLELTNINSDLMMQFAEKAPGTFQHTLQVSNLATEAAKKIGANSLLVRTGALYHDIGKMKHPDYFIENQLGGPNPLSNMNYEDAAAIIIGHVHDGIEIAKKEHLPEQIIHFIGTHHGLSKTKYFYNAFINANPDQKPNDEHYTYPGPLPDTKETAILMMADAVEARARSLKTYTEESINDCVELMIDSQIADGQFKKAPISFRDVETVKAIFKEKIKNMYHTRIVYPEIKKTPEP